MKNIKRYMIIYTALIIGTFLIGNINVLAINWAGIKLECIYEDGGAYTSSNSTSSTTVYKCPDGSIKLFGGRCDDGTQSKEVSVETVVYKTNRFSYNLNGVSMAENSTNGNIEYVRGAFDATNHSCRPYLRRGLLADSDGDITQTTTYFKFGSSKSNTKFEEDDFDDPGWWAELWGALSAEEKLEQIEENDETFGLVSERYILTEDAGEPEFTLTYVQESEQPSGSSNFIYLMFFYDYDKSEYVIILKTPNKTTRVTNQTALAHFKNVAINDKNEVLGISSGDTIYINNPEAKTVTDSNAVASYYYEKGQTTYTITTSATSTNTRKYVLFNTATGSGDVPSDELCEEIMPETSKILKEVIKYAQILVPIFMICLSAFDIGKIVVSGNIDEELPKQKKKIIARLIVGIIFFFLPLLVILVIDMLQTSGGVNTKEIKQIRCLFE